MWFDTHAHLFLLGETAGEKGPSTEVIDRTIREARQAGVLYILCVAIDLQTSLQAVATARMYPGRVFAAVGVHPNSAGEAHHEDWARITELAECEEVIAIGETGLDWFRDFTPPEVQKIWFERHWRLSQKVGKPLVVHCRDAETEMTELLSRWHSEGGVSAVMHACSAPWDIVQQWLTIEGVMISFAGSLTYRNAKFAPLRETARQVPLERVLVETDCPYLVPEPFRGRVKSSVPAHVRHTGQFLAELKGLPVESLAQQTTHNAVRFFGISADQGSLH